MTPGTRNLVAAVLLALFAGTLVVGARSCGPPPEPTSVYRHASGNLVFTYHTPTATEGLFDVEADPKLLRDLSRERPADLERLRGEFLRKLGIRSLEELRLPDEDLIRRLESQGYVAGRPAKPR